MDFLQLQIYYKFVWIMRGYLSLMDRKTASNRQPNAFLKVPVIIELAWMESKWNYGVAI